MSPFRFAETCNNNCWLILKINAPKTSSNTPDALYLSYQAISTVVWLRFVLGEIDDLQHLHSSSRQCQLNIMPHAFESPLMSSVVLPVLSIVENGLIELEFVNNRNERLKAKLW